MTFAYLTADQVIEVHDHILGPGEIAGLAMDKSLDAALNRVWNQWLYAGPLDLCDFAALHAEVLARGHTFNDGNKRTAFQVMRLTLTLNGLELDFPDTEVADLIIQLAQGLIHAEDLAAWLRQQPPLTIEAAKDT